MATTYIALLPAINVGGSKKIKMTDLRACFEVAGCHDVATYIQSGNVVFTSTTARAKVIAAVEREIVEGTGHEVPLILRTRAELEAVVAANPFAERQDDLSKLHVVFLDRAAEGSVPDLDLASFAPEELAIGHQELYLHLPDGMGRAKLPVALTRGSKSRPPMVATARNWRTTTKLLAMAQAV